MEGVMKARWNSIDCIKALACIAVVFIHFNFPGWLGVAVKTFCRFGVPVFFITSGFFFLQGGKMDDGKVAGKIRHILRLCIGAGLFYAWFTVAINHAASSSWSAGAFAVERLTADRIVKFFVTNDPFLYSHLWFLMGLLYCYLFALVLFGGNKRLNWVGMMMPALLIAYSCLQEFGGALGIQRSLPIPGTDKRVYLFNLFLFRGMPFLLAEILLYRHQNAVRRIPLGKVAAIGLGVVGGCIAIVERMYFEESQFYVGTYLTLAAMMTYAIRHPEGGSRLLVHIGRDLSLYVYILHIAVGRVLDITAGKLGLRESGVYLYGRAVLVLLLSLLVAECIYQGKRRLSWSPTSANGPEIHLD